MGEKEKQLVLEAFETNWIAPLGPHVNGFEKDISAYLQVGHTAALSTGTAAIHLALVLLDIKPGDIVLCQSMTFAGTTNPILYQGAIPVFIDSELSTWNMDPDALEDALKHFSRRGVKPKAIIPVHLYGLPAQMNQIRYLGEKFGVPIVEDAAESLGSTYYGKKCGGLGTLGALSFNGNKIITTGGGGALTGNDERLIQKARFLATQARDPAPHYEHSHVGYNYRLSNVLAGIGRGQMKVLENRVNQRRSNFDRYRIFFEKWNRVGYSFHFQEEQEGMYSNRWLSCILIDPKLNNELTRETLREEFNSANVDARPLWKPMHLQPIFEKYSYFGGENCEILFKDGLCLPSGSNLADADFERIFSVMDRLLKRVDHGSISK